MHHTIYYTQLTERQQQNPKPWLLSLILFSLFLFSLSFCPHLLILSLFLFLTSPTTFAPPSNMLLPDTNKMVARVYYALGQR